MMFLNVALNRLVLTILTKWYEFSGRTNQTHKYRLIAFLVPNHLASDSPGPEISSTQHVIWPFCVFLLIIAWPYVSTSWKLLESSREAGGLPLVFLLKSLIMILPALLLSQAFLNVTDAWKTLRAG